MNDILAKLASVSGKRAQELNVELANNIATINDTTAIYSLIEGLEDKNKAIRHDCIKTLYEIAERNPKLISPSAKVFVELLSSKDNRLQWGAMTALSAIVKDVPELIFENLNAILAVADKGSVITKDHAVKILAALSFDKKYAGTTLPLLLDQIMTAPNNQLPSYAEHVLPVLQDSYKKLLIKILSERILEVTPESKKKRIEKVLKKLTLSE